MKEGIVREPRRSPYLEVLRPRSEVHEYWSKLGASIEKLNGEFDAVVCEMERVAHNPSAVTDYPTYRKILNKKMELLADEWQRMHVAHATLEEAGELVGGNQDMGEA